MLKRILPVLFAMCLMLSVGTLTAFADDYEAKIGDAEYVTLEEALAEAAKTKAKDVITLLSDVETDEIIEIDSHVEILGNGHTVTGTAAKTFEVYANTIMTNVKVVNTAENGRCVDTRKAITLKLLTGTELIAKNGSSQPLTIGGSTNGTNVTLNSVKIDAGDAGYGIIAFVKTNLTIGGTYNNKTNVSGYAALYMKEGTSGSFVNINGASILIGTNNYDGNDNDFGTIVYEDDNIETRIHSSSKIVANGNGSAAQSLFMFNAGSVENPNKIDFYNKGGAVTLEANGNAVFTCGTNLESAVVETNTAATKTAFENAGYDIEENKVIITPTAIVDGIKYALWEDAVKVATNKNTAVEVIADVDLANDAEVTEVVVSEGATLDLCGKNLTADVTANGNIIDSTDGTGSVVGNITVNNHANKSYIPLPEEGAYRLFEISVKNQGIQLINDNARFLFTIMFNNKEAYKLLSLDSEADILCVEFVVTGEQAEEGTIVIGATTVKNFADAAYEQLNDGDKEETSKAISFTVKVSSYDTGDTISATPLIKTANGVVIGGFDTMTYTKE